ncbi:unnamed protein product [Bemisia tabaci]|uniref:DUF1294 domain-containing protein n=1 Tax=Bemisia tabaci TaxID=7038 RepID=A0A9P0FA63_BEMTA|nr:unnamed protein product [Bemisia tabaci]
MACISRENIPLYLREYLSIHNQKDSSNLIECQDESDDSQNTSNAMMYTDTLPKRHKCWIILGSLPLLVPVAVFALPAYRATQAWLEAGQWWWLAIYGTASLISIVLYGYDKLVAGSNMGRIPEIWLHGLALAGGWPGALLAQHLFRHKIRKVPFQIVFWPIIALHQVFWWFCSPDVLVYYQHEITVALLKTWEDISQRLAPYLHEISATLSKIWERTSQLLAPYLHEISATFSKI